jgi:hypothetical protein
LVLSAGEHSQYQPTSVLWHLRSQHAKPQPMYVSHRESTMNRSCILTLTATALLGLSAGSNALADETLKFREVLHATNVQSQEVGDVEGHAVSVFRFSGIASLADGSVGTASFMGANDYIKGSGPFGPIYNNVTLKDGSSLWYKTTGTATLEGSTTAFQGTATVLGGTGRFQGAKGNGTISGARLTPLTTGADLYLDVVIDVKK